MRVYTRAPGFFNEQGAFFADQSSGQSVQQPQLPNSLSSTTAFYPSTTARTKRCWLGLAAITAIPKRGEERTNKWIGRMIAGPKRTTCWSSDITTAAATRPQTNPRMLGTCLKCTKWCFHDKAQHSTMSTVKCYATTCPNSTGMSFERSTRWKEKGIRTGFHSRLVLWLVWLKHP